MCVCVCVVYVYVCMCTYIYVLNFPIFCAIWLKKCDFLTQKLGIKKDPDPKLFIPDPDPDPDPAKKFRIRPDPQHCLKAGDTDRPFKLLFQYRSCVPRPTPPAKLGRTSLRAGNLAFDPHWFPSSKPPDMHRDAGNK